MARRKCFSVRAASAKFKQLDAAVNRAFVPAMLSEKNRMMAAGSAGSGGIFVMLVLALAMARSLEAQFLPTLRAQVCEPVVQMLMGGCSMRCAFPWETTVFAPGLPPKIDYALADNCKATAWVDPNAGSGTKLSFRFPTNLPKELNGTPFYGFDIANGYLDPEGNYPAYGRVRKFKLFYNGKPLYYVTLADSPRWQHVRFDDIFANQGDTMTLEILETYPGTQHPNAAITELILQGAH